MREWWKFRQPRANSPIIMFMVLEKQTCFFMTALVKYSHDRVFPCIHVYLRKGREIHQRYRRMGVIWCGVNRPKKTRMFSGYMNCTKHTFGDSAEANLEN